MGCKQLFSVPNLLVLLSMLPVVRCDYSIHLAGLVVACASAFVLLIVIIAVIVMALTWNSWYPSLQKSRGRVKMPRSYWRKKEEAKLRLLNTSRASHHTASTTLPPHSAAAKNGAVKGGQGESGVPNGNASRVHDTASWVQGWNDANPSEDNKYGTLTLAMDLGEEKEEPEFRIETSVVDDETLDLGPFPSATVHTMDQHHTPTVTTQQTVTMYLGDEEEEERGEAVSGERYVTPLVIDRPRQVTVSYTPPPPPPSPPPASSTPPPPNPLPPPPPPPPPSFSSSSSAPAAVEDPQPTTTYSQFLNSSVVAF
ncbi:uncharacterized protein LOC143280917 [Babylonia areolata]|uniref:uncharacterized protein LOC143280917 n=1 Tax=Babylonia areolata TaxID=304850 RepID=UPI003FD15820